MNSYTWNRLVSFIVLIGVISATSFAQTGAPDRDGDGVPDDQDRCVSEMGPATNNGCPLPPANTPVPPSVITPETRNTDGDRDGDGVSDSADACPDTFGTSALGGCPELSTPEPTVEPIVVPVITLLSAPTLEYCAVSTRGTDNVNIRAEASSQSEIVGVISPNEWVAVLSKYSYPPAFYAQNEMGNEIPQGLFPFTTAEVDPNYATWLLVQDSNTSAVGWVAEAVIRYSDDCGGLDIAKPSEDTAYMSYKLSDLIVSSATGDSSSAFSGVRVASGDVDGDGRAEGIPVFPSENPFLFMPYIEQEAAVDYFLKIDGIDGESEAPAVTESLSLNFVDIEALPDGCSVSQNASIVQAPVCADGSTPNSVTLCTYQQLVEVGVWELVCYEVQIPEGCTIETPEAGVWQIVCEETVDSFQVTPVGQTTPILDIQWDDDSVGVALLLPAVQKVREAAAR